MRNVGRSVTCAALILFAFTLSGCFGAMQVDPDKPVGAGGLVPNTPDKDAGLVAFGGASRDHLRESVDDWARDLAKFLARLSRGEAPKN